MKNILALIEEKQQTYYQSPLFKFMQDKSIHPLKRLSFAPCAAPFIMSFSDLCKYVLRQEPTDNEIQAILNQHTYEDDSHWQWFLEDLDTLGFNNSLQSNDSLRFFWSDAAKHSRLLTHELYKLIVESEPTEKLIILEAIEATAEVLFSFSTQITKELQLITKQEYKYFGNCHFNAENSHSANSDDTSKFIENIHISPECWHNSVELIDKVFELFTQWNNALLAYAQNHQVSQLPQMQAREQVLAAV
ncbi:hypothetical protein IQ255_24810 [Pleurocapsales cyanobacterium LEGE 10410]|nr:hypothetical protein [Pleurocapsales cyanobacterium LEGE 10410]